MAPDVPAHRRTIVVEGFDRDDHLELVGTLTDERPWVDEEAGLWVRVLHEMSLTLKVDLATLVITDARADMRRFPHEECQTIEPAFHSLVGLSITRGYLRAVQERFGRERGCSHLEHLARAMGPAAIQTTASVRGQRGDNIVADGDNRTPSAWLTNTCHLWAEGGIGAQKMAGGWRPGATRYPTPSLVELRREPPRSE